MKNILRKIRLKIGKFLLDRKSKKPIYSPNHSIPTPMKKIIFLRHDGKIGDYIVSSFIFRELKKQDPQLYIGVVCSTKTQYLFKENKFIDKLYVVKTKNIANYAKVAYKIRQENYDLLIDPTLFLRNRDLLLIKLINAKINLGYKKENYKLFDLNINDENNLHFSQIYQKSLELIGYKNINTSYDIPCNKKSQKEIESFLQKNNLHQFIVINFFGSSSSRHFNDSHIYSFLTYISKQTTLPLVLLTFPDVNKKLKHIASQFPNVFIFDETKTIFHSIELIRYAQLVISPDTAIIHIASGLNKPIITFYNNDEQNFTHWHPNSTAPLYILRYNNNVNEITPEQLQPEWFKQK